ncbi:MAG TPA: glycosyl hydrolase family 18 protein [Bacteroidales bacterium]|nr:glycosyl hydrolase family 18 protein [Bacteroidales bacterium]HNS47061.1 glycosyl hydrolase family 18 protein [Bacteroidales bacterium]
MTRKWIAGLLGCVGYFSLLAQETPYVTIHQEQSRYYSRFEFTRESQFDSLNGLQTEVIRQTRGPGQLKRTVFGYHPYWMGSAYLNYQWDLLSDLCYFSFEVDPYTGTPVSLHNWMAAPVIDSALSSGVDVHLCITLFSAHMALFSNTTSQQTLIDTAVSLVKARNAKGVNLDFESVPSSLSFEFNQFLLHFAQEFHTQLPDKMVSLAVPAVDPNGLFNLELLEPVIDMFMIMGYDYYWNGSGMAGPVAGLYSMVSSFDYNLSRSVSWFQSKGIPNAKIVLGLPYYGRQWPVEKPLAPSSVTGWGTALTYYTIRNSTTGSYSDANKHWESNSFSPYYSFQADRLYQCFIDDVRSLGKRFDLVNQRGLAGIGIWALGYDHGYDDFWQLIRDKFTVQAPAVYQDTLYDSGGPAYAYYPGEDYFLLIEPSDCKELNLTFQVLDLENGIDYVFVHDGRDTTAPLLGQLTGDSIPVTFTASQGAITLHILTNQTGNFSGWKAIWHCGPMSIQDSAPFSIQPVRYYPNPVTDCLHLELSVSDHQVLVIETHDMKGILTGRPVVHHLDRGEYHLIHDPGGQNLHPGGLYVTRMTFGNGVSQSIKWIFSGQ